MARHCTPASLRSAGKSRLKAGCSQDWLPHLGASEQAVEELARSPADFLQRDIEWVLVQVRGGPSLYQVCEHFELCLRSRQTALGMPCGNALSVIERAIEGRRIAQERCVGGLQMAHLFDDVDT